MKLKEIHIPLLLFLMFFVMQTYFFSYEIMLTLICICICAVIFILNYNRNEYKLFLIGVVLGFLIEVGLGQIARTQYWNYGSLLGVPYWLPFVWGIGFVIITRVGIIIRR